MMPWSPWLFALSASQQSSMVEAASDTPSHLIIYSSRLDDQALIPTLSSQAASLLPPFCEGQVCFQLLSSFNIPSPPHVLPRHFTDDRGSRVWILVDCAFLFFLLRASCGRGRSIDWEKSGQSPSAACLPPRASNSSTGFIPQEIRQLLTSYEMYPRRTTRKVIV